MLKQHVHIGIVVETPTGLLVPVIPDAERKCIAEIAQRSVRLGAEPRGNRDRMSGGCFTLSSLGSVGGAFFTPIIYAPELAIMEISLSLSYDLRFINGTGATRIYEFFYRDSNPV